jgi:translation initiation factor IF-3
MKVKVTLRFRGRELAHPEFGFQVVEKFIKELTVYGHPDAPPKKIGKGINVMLSPLPRNKRAKNPRQHEGAPVPASLKSDGERERSLNNQPSQKESSDRDNGYPIEEQSGRFVNNPFSQIDIKAVK